MSRNGEGTGSDDAKRNAELRDLEGIVERTIERTPPALDARVHARIQSEFDAEPRASAGNDRATRGGERRLALVGAALAAAVVLVMLGSRLEWFKGRDHLVVSDDPDPVAATDSSSPEPAPEPAQAPITPQRSSSREAVATPKAARAEPDDDSGIEPDPAAATAREMNPGSNRVVPRTSSGIPTNLDANRTVSSSTVIARMSPVDDGNGDRRGDDGFRNPAGWHQLVEITAVYKGEAALVKSRVALQPASSTVDDRRSFTSWDLRAKDEFWKRGSSFVAPIELMTRPPSGRELRATKVAQVVLGQGFAVTLLSADLPDVGPFLDDARVAEQLLEDLAESLDDSRAAVRESAITALLHSQGDRSDGRGLGPLWANGPIADRVLARWTDPNPRVRWVLAQMGEDTTSLDPEERVAFHSLLFDPVPLVRREMESSEASSLDRKGNPALSDVLFDERHSRSIVPHPLRVTTARDVEHAARAVLEHADPVEAARYAEALAGTGGSRGSMNVAIDALSRALKERDFEVRRAAAEALGRLGDRSVVNLLGALRSDEDPRFLVAVAASQLRLGDERGTERLKRIVHGTDVRAAMQAFVVIAELIGEELDEEAVRHELVQVLFSAIEIDDSVDGIVRAEALLRLATLAHALNDAERIRLDDWIAQSATSPSLRVQFASKIAPAFIARGAMDEELEDLRRLGYAVGK